jgi:Amt family ammonium transporter
MSETGSNHHQHWMDRLPSLIFVEREGVIVFANRAACELLGYQPVDLIGKPAQEIIWGLYPGAAEPLGQGAVAPLETAFDCRILAAAGNFISVRATYTVSDAGTREATIVALPITVPEIPHNNLLEEVLNSAPEAIAITHGERILHVNPSFTRLFGYSEEESIGSSMDELILPETRHHEPGILRYSVEKHGRASMETVRKAKDGDLVDVSMLVGPMMLSGVRIGYYWSFRDIRERKLLEEKLEYDTLHDTLTGLANRTLFLDRLRQAIARRSRRKDLKFVVMFLDLDHFKEVNDTMGHASGDEVLVATAARLMLCFRPQDTVARMGGDEFAVLLEGASDPADIRSVAERVSRDLAEPYEVFGHQLHVGASLGIVFDSPEHQEPEEMLRDADFAMYRAKQAGGSRFEMFDTGMQVTASRQQNWERELRQAIENREFVVWYQPVYRLQDGTLEGFEALLRWQRPDGTFQPFEDLLPLAEETGMMIAIGQDVVEQACRQLKIWQRQKPGIPLNMSVNLSTRQFIQPDLVDCILETVHRIGIPPANLRLEISEKSLNSNPDAAVVILQRLVDGGVKIALDNFGSGLASMNHLVRLPIHIVKLDRRLIAYLPSQGRHAALLGSIFDLCRVLRVEILAEGIESADQMESLRRNGCLFGQGHFFSPAVPPQQAAGLIAQRYWHATAASAIS